MTNQITLASLGWQPFYQQQLTLDEWDNAHPVRVTEQHRSRLEVAGDSGITAIPITPSMPSICVGDWLLLDTDGHFLRLLQRKSCFRRKAAGSRVSEQLIAANVDSAFIVCSLNRDFNLNRIERYLALAHKAAVEPVVVLSKVDLCPDPEGYREAVQKLDSLLSIELVNGLDPASTVRLRPWCQPGNSVVLLGSSGAGKSTLGNSLLGETLQATGTIREDDARGRHTTTRRSLLRMANGALLLDTPGMRELQLGDCENGVAATFSDIEQLATHCRFGDCQHLQEPGCAVRKALEEGRLEARRLDNYHKLLREQALNRASLAERRAGDRELGRFYKRTQRESTKIKRGT
ncbi:MAG: ribosome small subunit-dependent GTPase A [Sedimenticola sp.]|nr:ribosome small subunit-dependent GTPase A [Sedimenticola sp.]